MKTIISHVVALSNNRVIGKDNDLPWNLKTDLKHFREYTTNKILIMGRKTFESIGRPLPNRTNIIVSKTIQSIEGAEVFSDLNSALNKAKENCETLDKNEIVIISRFNKSNVRKYQIFHIRRFIGCNSMANDSRGSNGLRVSDGR